WMVRGSHIFIGVSLLFKLIELNHRIGISRIRPVKILVGSFALLIVVGTGLLMLPAATAPGEGETVFTSALFTATSAVCVTGLIVENTGQHWSAFGQTVILVLIQLGGLGIMTFGSIFAIMLWRGMGIRETALMRDVLSHNLMGEISRIVVFILIVTFCFEIAGALLLFGLWDLPGMSVGMRAYHSVFHSISGFCNAGFSLYSDSFASAGLRNNWRVLIVLVGLIVCGGIGFVVLLNLVRIGSFRFIGLAGRMLGKRQAPDFRHSRLSLQTKIVLSTTVVLIVLGTVLTFAFESLPLQGAGARDAGPPAPDSLAADAGEHAPVTKYSPMGEMPWHKRLAASYFLSITTRTAGFNTTDTSRLTPSTKFLTIVLMVIGASPGSTGGGIKTVTLAVILVSIWSLARGRDQPQAFRRSIRNDLVRRAMTVLALAVAMITIMTMAISATGMKEGTRYEFLDVLFETTSAFGTVGLTTGQTVNLNNIGRMLIIVTMFVGRLGPVTLFIALPTKGRGQNFDYPMETVAVG
ncbi:MAG: potassium transporter TrkG, partial [Planctomycetia bacterium]|nr:potassium transporter TrkG [Planctomycetia bacterium]